MYLKRLELSGFKSFADKTRLEFEPGISAIVGPNGCGKSNISDAIRWCLGEQSARSMRSHQMMDVIFNGSQNRATTGMAEVSLTFDNSKRLLPIDYSEITVTRRLFRSGESEYYLNKTQCRLKDIKDLFLDTGIGAEGYAIMEQGKVEFVLSAKPEDRRELFEEAAGVSKFKARREESLRKLEKVDVDMNRVNDMLAMLKEQTASLDLAAKKARQYQKLHDDVKRFETALIIQKIDSSERENTRLSAEIEPKKTEYEQINTHYNQIEALIQELRLSQLQKDEEYVKYQNELSETKAGVNLCDERIAQASRREKEYLETREQLKNEILANEQTITEQSTELDNLNLMVENLKQEVSQLEADYQAKDIRASEIRNIIIELINNIEQTKQKLFEFARQRTDLNNEANRLASLNVKSDIHLESLHREYEGFQQSRNPLAQEIESRQNELSELENSRQALLAKEHETSLRFDELSTKESELQKSLDGQKSRLLSCEVKKQTLEDWEKTNPERQAIRTVISLDMPGIKGPLGSLIRILPGQEDHVARALGEKLNYLLADTVQTAEKAIKYLEDNSMGRVTFVILERLPELSQNNYLNDVPGTRPVSSLLKFDDELSKAVNFICSNMFVSGRTIYGNALISGGHSTVFEKPVLVDEELKRYSEEIDNAKNAIAALNAEIENIKNLKIAAYDEKKNLDLEIGRLNVRFEYFAAEMNSKQEALSIIDRNIQINDNEKNAELANKSKIEEEMKALAQMNLELDRQETELSQESVKHDAELASARTEEAQIIPLLTESKVAWATQANELTGREREAAKLVESAELLKQQTENAKNEYAAIEIKVEEEKHIQSQESEKLQGLHSEMKLQEEVVSTLLDERQKIITELEAYTNQVYELKQQLDAVETTLHELEMEKRSFELQMQNMTERLKSDFGLTFAESKENFINITTTEDDIQRMKRRLESMGPVNLAAPEEYANLEERYNFLLTQQQDLLKAKEDLHQVILKINHSTKENFKLTFDKIRENFRTIYKQLFEGGEADLILTDETNMLETGVDIFAQPPGKKLQNIALLSGGEKALTAIALLFAFFMVRTSPFCILDEVDAPLDEANVGRFNSMVKSFSENTQFLMITHSKRTMTIAQILYGITMEELGVSKIISVKLQKEETVATAL